MPWMGKPEDLPIIWSDRKVKPKNPHVNNHEADMKKLVRTTNLKKSREVCLLEKNNNNNVKTPDTSTALLLSQNFLCLVFHTCRESHLAPCGLEVRAGGTIYFWQLDKRKHNKFWLYRDWDHMKPWVSLISRFVLHLSDSNFFSKYEVFGLPAKNLFIPWYWVEELS